MTIDEAIEEYKKRVENDRQAESLFLHDDLIWNAKQEHILAEHHEQLAEWLEDYKRVKKWKDEIMEEFCRYDASSIEELMQRARNKAIDDMKSEWDKRFKNLIQWCKDGRLMGLRQADFIFDEIAQQLKEGAVDGNSTTDN